jgi:hypothetical protein
MFYDLYIHMVYSQPHNALQHYGNYANTFQACDAFMLKQILVAFTV